MERVTKINKKQILNKSIGRTHGIYHKTWKDKRKKETLDKNWEYKNVGRVKINWEILSNDTRKFISKNVIKYNLLWRRLFFKNELMYEGKISIS